MIRLEVMDGPAQGARHESSSEVVRIGRAADSDVVLPDEHVSGEHARIVFGPDAYVLRDMRSTNGTLLNDGALTGEAELIDGDVVRIGDTEFRFEAHA